MNQRQLMYFVEVYKSGSIKKTAEKLIVSPQGVSKMIKNLEDEIGLDLFIRKGNVLLPSKAAESLYPHALKILEEFSFIGNGSHLRKLISIYALDDIFQYLPPFLELFHKEYPDIRLKIIEATNNQAIEHLKADECDFAILQSPFNVQGYANEYLFSYPFGLVINKKNPLSKKEEIQHADLHNKVLAGHGSDYYLFDNFILTLNKEGIYPNLLLESNNEELLFSLAERNIAIAALSEHFALTHLKDNLVYRSLGKEANDNLYITYKTSHSLSDEAIAFKSMLISWIKGQH